MAELCKDCSSGDPSPVTGRCEVCEALVEIDREMAAGLSPAQARQLLDAAGIAPRVSCGRIRFHVSGSADSALLRKGLVRQRTSDATSREMVATDAGTRVARLLAAEVGRG